MSTASNSVFPVAPGCATVLPETDLREPSKGEFEKMARRRFQAPKPVRRGKWWCLRYWQDEFKDGRRRRRRVRVNLAPAKMPEREARKIAAEHLRPMNQGLTSVGSATNFTEFVDNVYIQVSLPKMASSTRDRYEGIIDNYLKPQFGDLCLRDISVLTVDRYISGLSKTKLSHESMDKVRDVLSSILQAAVRYELLVKNPVEGIRLPKPNAGNRSKPFVTPDQFGALLKLIAEPYASMTYVAVYTGLRVSELVGLRWRNVHHDSISIEERYCRGDWGVPKSQASNATIPVNRSVIERIHHLKSMTVEVKAGRATRRYAAVKSCGPDDLVFQSVQTGAPMRDNNILVRHIKPAARKLGLDFVNWQVLRRSFATWLKLAGADVKDAQSLMRHSRVGPSLGCL